MSRRSVCGLIGFVLLIDILLRRLFGGKGFDDVPLLIFTDADEVYFHLVSSAPNRPRLSPGNEQGEKEEGAHHHAITVTLTLASVSDAPVVN